MLTGTDWFFFSVLCCVVVVQWLMFFQLRRQRECLQQLWRQRECLQQQLRRQRERLQEIIKLQAQANENFTKGININAGSLTKVAACVERLQIKVFR